MALVFQCSTCGKKIKARDDSAGKKARCPYCQAMMFVPEPVSDAEEGPAKQETYAVHKPPPRPPKGEEREPCPACGEMILAGAVKCRFCGEIFDEELKRASLREQGGDAESADVNLDIAEIVLVILCSFVACVL